MPTRIVLPSLGMYTAEGRVVRWLVHDGGRVELGAPVLEIETEKAVNEVIAPAAGVLRHVAAAGDLVSEEGLLGHVWADDEAGSAESAVDAGAPRHVEPQPSAIPVTVPTAAAAGRARASPLARKLAAEHGADLALIEGSGPAGRIVEADILAYVERRRREPAGEVPPAPRNAPLSLMRKTIGERLRSSLDTAVPLTLTREVQVDALVAAREALSARLGTPAPWDAFFVKLLALALRARPALNAVLEEGALRTFEAVDVAFAVAVPGGLLTPVVRGADTFSLPAIAERVRTLAQRALEGKLRPEDTSGGVSTLTNLGARGVDAFTPILNPPHSSILGVGRIARRPVVVDGVVDVASTCWLSLTFDHRVADGGPAAELLEEIAHLLGDASQLSSLVEGKELP
jgi:pyruvate dehydrogenase E2 component (dihydrolipoamide acetyltransferase)